LTDREFLLWQRDRFSLFHLSLSCRKDTYFSDLPRIGLDHPNLARQAVYLVGDIHWATGWRNGIKPAKEQKEKKKENGSANEPQKMAWKYCSN